MKSSSHFKQTRYTAVQVGATARRFCDARQNFQQCAFPGAGSSDDADHFTGLCVKADAIECPDSFTARAAPRTREQLKWGHRGASDCIAQCAIRRLASTDTILLCQPFCLDHRSHHVLSDNVGKASLNTPEKIS